MGTLAEPSRRIFYATPWGAAEPIGHVDTVDGKRRIGKFWWPSALILVGGSPVMHYIVPPCVQLGVDDPAHSPLDVRLWQGSPVVTSCICGKLATRGEMQYLPAH